MFQNLNVVGFPHFNCHAQELVSFVMNKRASKKMEQVTLKWKFHSFNLQIVSFDGAKPNDFFKNLQKHYKSSQYFKSSEVII